MDLNTILAYSGAIGGALIGILGGVVGTWASIRNTLTPAERAFMVRCVVGTWLLVAAFLAGLFLIPAPYNYLLWIPYPIVLILGIRWMNARQAEIRQREQVTKR